MSGVWPLCLSLRCIWQFSPTPPQLTPQLHPELTRHAGGAFFRASFPSPHATLNNGKDVDRMPLAPYCSASVLLRWSRVAPRLICSFGCVFNTRGKLHERSESSVQVSGGFVAGGVARRLAVSPSPRRFFFAAVVFIRFDVRCPLPRFSRFGKPSKTGDHGGVT